jgi:ribosomal 30S subunit maturation factor RimM
MIFLLLGLEVVEEDGSLLGLLTPILDNNARAVDNLACVSLTVQHT